MTATELHERVTLRFFVPQADLQPYISSIYLMEIALPPGETLTDWLMPEWASLRISRDEACRVGLEAAALGKAPRMMVAGPTSHALKVEAGSARIWGVGILPLGWARLVGVPASLFANRLTDGCAEPGLACLAPLYDTVIADDADFAATATRIADHFRALLRSNPELDDEARIVAAHHCLIDEHVGSVGELARRLDLSPRTLERFCLRVFGFSPKLLLRRQRFTRSLAQFLLDPSLAWIETLDPFHVDQSHFVRDFRHFMGMSPRAYAQADKPILRVTAHARNSALGGPVQALHRP